MCSDIRQRVETKGAVPDHKNSHSTDPSMALRLRDFSLGTTPCESTHMTIFPRPSPSDQKLGQPATIAA